jgi:hypothetical protein
MRSLRFLLLAATPFVISACASIVGFPDVPDIEDGGTTDGALSDSTTERLGVEQRVGVRLRQWRRLGVEQRFGLWLRQRERLGLEQRSGRRVRRKRLGRFVHARQRAVQRAAAAAVRLRRRLVELRIGLPVHLHDERLHGQLHARRHAVQRAHAADVRFDRNLGVGDAVHEHLYRRKLLGRVHARGDAVQRPAAAAL